MNSNLHRLLRALISMETAELDFEICASSHGTFLEADMTQDLILMLMGRSGRATY
jgi:hypothetical protein